MTNQQADYAASIATWMGRIAESSEIAAELGPRIVEADDEHVRIEFEKNEHTRREADGRWSGAALPAMAMVTAELMPYDDGELAMCLVVQLNVHLVANSREERIVGEGRWVRRGSSLRTSEVRLTDGAGEPVVVATATHVPITRAFYDGKVPADG